MQLKFIKSAKNLKDKHVLVRCDFDVPLTGSQIIDDSRLKDSLATINYLIKKKAKIILIGHLGRPHGKFVKGLSLKPVKYKLEKLLSASITLIPLERYVGQQAVAAAKAMQPGQIIMLENLRFSDRESKNCKKFAKKLASLADVYINNSFSASHRSHASIQAIQRYLPSYMGFNLEQEIKNLSPFIKDPKHPLVLIIGGAKVETKLPLIKNFINQADSILLGGAVANTFIKSLGCQIGRSLVDNKYIKPAKKIFSRFPAERILLPVDIKTKTAIKPIDLIGKQDIILDIGPQTIKLFNTIIKDAKTIIWNGPLGKLEQPKFADGTQQIAAQILKSKAKVAIGGGDTHKIFKAKKIPVNVFISSGGGAMLEFLAGKKLPGLGN